MMAAYCLLAQKWLRTASQYPHAADVSTRKLPSGWAQVFRANEALIGFGGGLFAVGALTTAIHLAHNGQSGLALGVSGAVQGAALGIAIVLGGVPSDLFSWLAVESALEPALTGLSAWYLLVYHLESLFLFATLIAVGLLVRCTGAAKAPSSSRLGLTELP
ncbi:PucC family protein [Thiorhodovibrio frisius]|uniref:PucC family protein n=1 Tax=Thiorhodovibrio frisius TaxID=631362 RepID=UPI00022C7837|nr:PucC family protein [Thiorhodovibrio frisius]WPL23943.1 LhaA/PucC family protein [Thiorhodovibrio frisius]